MGWRPPASRTAVGGSARQSPLQKGGALVRSAHSTPAYARSHNSNSASAWTKPHKLVLRGNRGAWAKRGTLQSFGAAPDLKSSISSGKFGQYDSSNLRSDSLSFGSGRRVERGHCSLALSMPGRPGYQHCFPSMLRQDQYPVRAIGSSVLHSITPCAVAQRGASTMPAARTRRIIIVASTPLQYATNPPSPLNAWRMEAVPRSGRNGCRCRG
jgi:hypothetical protein